MVGATRLFDSRRRPPPLAGGRVGEAGTPLVMYVVTYTVVITSFAAILEGPEFAEDNLGFRSSAPLFDEESFGDGSIFTGLEAWRGASTPAWTA
jgi:hypothetical protein